MRRSEVLKETMRFEDANEGWNAGRSSRPTCSVAAVSPVPTFQRRVAGHLDDPPGRRDGQDLRPTLSYGS
jgi:hypothetical protein